MVNHQNFIIYRVHVKQLKKFAGLPFICLFTRIKTKGHHLLQGVHK